MTVRAIGTRAQWDAARADLLEREKDHTRLGDELARHRRELPWVAVEKQVTRSTPRNRYAARSDRLWGYGALPAADDSVAFEAAYLDGRHPEQIREYGFGVLAKLRCAPDGCPGDC